ncbi:MAG TPA: hypothetical protein DCY79_18405 [Planctomycetaceae bacterium]|nr:hypothetical protein [Blastopirellula sp.]HAY81781.1 hypothetical protein [Planctomycetaceae bacterium]
MKVLIAPANRDSIAKLDFDHDIPTFPPWYQSRKYRHRRRSEYLFSQVDIILRTADDLALVNAGRLPVEFSRPATDVYCDFLNDLIVIEGFTGILDSHRYGLSIEVGRLFQIDEVARRAAIVVQQSFYPDEALEIISENRHKLSEVASIAEGPEVEAARNDTKS